MRATQAKRIKKIIGSVEDAPSRRMYRAVKKAFTKIPSTDKEVFLNELRATFNK